MKQNQLIQKVFFFGGIITVIGAITELMEYPFAPFIFSLGISLLVGYHFYIAWNNKDAELRTQRITRSGFISSLLLILGAYFMFTDSNFWVVAVLIYALSSFFLSFRGE